MAHQFVREPLRAEEADRLANACRSPEEKLIVWTLLDTGLRVSELCSLTLDNVQWQQRSLRVTGKAGPHGSRRKQRIVPLSARVRAILEPYFAPEGDLPGGRAEDPRPRSPDDNGDLLESHRRPRPRGVRGEVVR